MLGYLLQCMLGSPPVNRMTNRCKNITLATNSLRPVINAWKPVEFVTLSVRFQVVAWWGQGSRVKGFSFYRMIYFAISLASGFFFHACQVYLKIWIDYFYSSHSFHWERNKERENQRKQNMKTKAWLLTIFFRLTYFGIGIGYGHIGLYFGNGMAWKAVLW